jgi:hypothetical protein
MDDWKLFLDDQWDDPEMPFRHPPPGFKPAKSSLEAMVLIETRGLPSFISFDHDLGGEDNAMAFIVWMSDEHYSSKVPDYQIHSANPAGAANIHSKMESWRRSQEL